METVRNVYYGMATARLREIRSKKQVRVKTLESLPRTYWTQQELRKLRQQIIWIDAVIAARTNQLELL